MTPRVLVPKRRRRPSELELLAMIRVRLMALGVPPEYLSDKDLRRGIRQVVRALDNGTLALGDLLQFCSGGRA